VDADTSATCDSTNSLTIKCTQSNPPYSVQLYRYNLLYGNVMIVKNHNQFVIDKLPHGSYYVKVYGDGATGDAFGKTSVKALMPKPVNPSTSNILSTQAKLNWNAVSCAAYYRIQYRKASVAIWTAKTTVGNVT